MEIDIYQFLTVRNKSSSNSNKLLKVIPLTENDEELRMDTKLREK